MGKLHDAVAKGDFNKVKELVEIKKENVNKIDFFNKYTPIYYAIKNHNINIVKYLVEHGADIHEIDTQGKSALYYAIQFCDYEIAKYLLIQGADPYRDGLDSLISLAKNYCQGQTSQKIISLLEAWRLPEIKTLKVISPRLESVTKTMENISLKTCYINSNVLLRLRLNCGDYVIIRGHNNTPCRIQGKDNIPIGEVQMDISTYYSLGKPEFVEISKVNVQDAHIITLQLPLKDDELFRIVKDYFDKNDGFALTSGDLLFTYISDKISNSYIRVPLYVESTIPSTYVRYRKDLTILKISDIQLQAYDPSIRDNIDYLKMRWKSSKSSPSEPTWDPSIWIGRELYGYKVISVIGTGGNGYVLKVELGGNIFAMKILSVFSASYSNTVSIAAKNTFDQLFRESENLKRLSQIPVFVTIYGIYVDSNIIKNILRGDIESYIRYPPAIVMDFMEGGSVDKLLKKKDLVTSNLWPYIVKEIIKETALALAYLHYYGFAHLDVKPQNIFLKKPVEGMPEVIYKMIFNNVRLGDLGAAVRIGGKVEQLTLAYCPPDQIEAAILGQGAHPSMDIFALGMTAYYMLTLKVGNPSTTYLSKAFDSYLYGEPNEALHYLKQAKEQLMNWKLEFPPNTPQDLKEVIIKSLSVDPYKRPTAREIYNSLK